MGPINLINMQISLIDNDFCCLRMKEEKKTKIRKRNLPAAAALVTEREAVRWLSCQIKGN